MRKHQQEGRVACAVSGVSDGGKPAPAFGVTYFEVSHQTASGGGRHVGYVRTRSGIDKDYVPGDGSAAT